ncbi:MAG: transglutaminase-like domain-containing protein [Treponema sp.]|jgi:hypothetical protein|nr:transglutaminase-like domain-containing protein [Treponema sp.]
MNSTGSAANIAVIGISIMVMLGACATNHAVAPVEEAEQDAQYQQEQQYTVLRGILKMYGAFRGTTENVNITFQTDFANGNFSVLKNKYGLDAIAGNGDDLSKSLNILFWVCNHVRHKGNYDNHVPMNALDLLEYSYDKGTEQGLNCLNLSYIVTECLLSIGIPARTIGIYPFSPYDADNHVITHAYIESLDTWIMLDPTWCSYIKDADGRILNILEIRTAIADGRELFLNEEFAYNGEKLSTNSERVQFYKWYMAKNLFYFDTNEVSGFGREDRGRALMICPAGFNLFEAWMYNLEYRIEVARTYEGIDEAFRESYITSSTEQLENMRIYAEEQGDAVEKAYLYVSPEDFLAKPTISHN